VIGFEQEKAGEIRLSATNMMNNQVKKGKVGMIGINVAVLSFVAPLPVQSFLSPPVLLAVSLSRPVLGAVNNPKT